MRAVAAKTMRLAVQIKEEGPTTTTTTRGGIKATMAVRLKIKIENITPLEGAIEELLLAKLTIKTEINRNLIMKIDHLSTKLNKLAALINTIHNSNRDKKIRPLIDTKRN